MKLATLGLFLICLQGISVEATESDKLCVYLGSIANKATKANTDIASNPGGSASKNLNEIMQLTALIQKLDGPTTEAIRQRRTFEQFQSDMEKQSIHVSDFYKPIYLGKYLRNWCGQITEARSIYIDNGNVTSSSQTITVERQFDPSGDPYYMQMQHEPGSK